MILLVSSRWLMNFFQVVPFMGRIWWEYVDHLRHKWIWYKTIVLQQRLPRITVKHNVIFTHIPKAAGVSIRHAIVGREPFDYGIPGHIPIRYFCTLLGDNIHDYFKFTFVRHPITRLYSAYHFLKRGGWTQRGFIEDKVFSELFLSKFKKFEDFVEWLTPRKRFVYIHFYPQTYFITEREQILQDFIGRVETIDQDFEKLIPYLKRQGLRVRTAKLQRSNVSTKGKFPKLPTSLLYKVYDLYREDFDLLGYDPEYTIESPLL